MHAGRRLVTLYSVNNNIPEVKRTTCIAVYDLNQIHYDLNHIIFKWRISFDVGYNCRAAFGAIQVK